jgi:glycosyltransferase involved in cell wall biosynthesis
MEWQVLERADTVIDASGTIVDSIRDKFAREPRTDRVRHMPFGVEMPADLAEPERDPSEVRFLFVGRLEPRKGIDVLMDAIPAVVREIPHARFQIAGEAPGGGRAGDLLSGLPGEAARRVEFLGRVDDPTRDALYRDCHVFVAPSRYESFGIVFIEAMAWAKPVVAAEIGGATRIIVDGETGRLVPTEDAPALAAALIELAKDGESRIRLGRAARQRAESEYGIDRWVERTIDLYEETLSSRPSPVTAAAR